MSDEDLERIKAKIRIRFHVEPKHVRSDLIVVEVLPREMANTIINSWPAWKGVIEVFGLEGIQRNNICFAWNHNQGTSKEERIVSICEKYINKSEDALGLYVVAMFKHGYTA